MIIDKFITNSNHTVFSIQIDPIYLLIIEKAVSRLTLELRLIRRLNMQKYKEKPIHLVSINDK